MSDPTTLFVAERFGLSPSTSRTIAIIVTGGGVKVAARERGLSISVVRQHVQLALRLTGTHTQSELTAVVWRAWSMRTEEQPA